MFGTEFHGIFFWCIFPFVMIVLCLFMMRGRCMMGGRGTHGADDYMEASDSAMEILDKRYALGEINKEEYEETKRALMGRV